MIDNPDQQQPQLQPQESAFVQHVQPVRGDLPPAMGDDIPSLVDPLDIVWNMPGQLPHQVPVFNESILKSLSELKDEVKRENEELIENIKDQVYIGSTYFSEKDFLKAAECFRKAAEFCGQLKMHKQEDDGLEMSADCLFFKSCDCRIEGNYEEAIYYLGESSKIYEQLKITEKAKYNLRQMVSFYGKMGDDYLKKGDLTKAKESFENVAELLIVPEDKTKILVGAAIRFLEKKNECIKTGETAKEIECYDNAAVLYKKAGMQEKAMMCLKCKLGSINGMVVDYVKAGNPSKAAKYCDEMLKLCYMLEMPENAEERLLIFANSFYCKAMACEETLKLEDAASNYEKAAKFYNLLKDVEEGKKCLKEAADCFCDAAKGYASKGNSQKSKECYGKAAALYKELGESKEAKKYFERAGENLKPSASQSKGKTTKSVKKHKGRR